MAWPAGPRNREDAHVYTSRWDTSLGVNVKGTALMATSIAPLLRAAGGGAIINLGSISGYIAQPKRWTYNATKGAVRP